MIILNLRDHQLKIITYKSLTSYTKINPKCFRDLTVRSATIKFIEENISRTLFDINCSMIFYDPPLKVMKLKAKINKWYLIKLKSFCTAKESINKRRHPQSGRKYLQMMQPTRD